MKKRLLSLALMCMYFITANATTDTIHVANFQFTPSTLNAIVGDTILWIRDGGNHTTTSTSVPAGAADWNSPLNGGNRSFTYVITVAGTYNYWCIPHSPNMAGTIVATATLPVQLTNFTITNTAGNKAFISWNTLSEQNTAYFSVKKSNNGNKFTEIAKVNAVGNSTISHQYSYTDNNISSVDKYVYYMLEIVDKDGRMQLSDIKMFKNNAARSRLITSLSPNPISSSGHLMLQFNADKPGNMLVQLYDANGKFIKQTEMNAVSGLNNGHFHLGNLPAGVYTVIFTLDNIKETRKIVME